MPLPVIEDTWRVSFNWQPLDCANVMHFRSDTLAVDAIYDLINTHVSQIMWAFVDINQVIEEVVLTKLDGTSVSTGKITGGGAKWQGGATGAGIPGQAAILSMHTARRGRSYRGRAYLGPVGEAFTAGGLLDSSQITATLSAWNTFRTALAAGGLDHVVASYTHATADTIISYTMRHGAGTMRRRQDQAARGG